MHEAHVTRGLPRLSQRFVDEALEPPADDSISYMVDRTPEMRQPIAVLYKLMTEITRHMNEPWGFKERFAKPGMEFAHKASLMFENICVIITTPIPFPYVHLCKVLLLCFLISSPLIIKIKLGFFCECRPPDGCGVEFAGH
jgi:hypothetical protein